MASRSLVLSVGGATTLFVLAATGAQAGGLANPSSLGGLTLTAAQPVGYYYNRCYWKRVRYYDRYSYRYYYRTKKVCY